MFDIYGIGKHCYNSLKNVENFKGFSNSSNDEFYIKKYSNMEEYEKNVNCFNVNNKDIVIFSESYEDLNGILLKLLENYEGKKYVVLFVKQNNLSNKQSINQKITCGILQEYARSGYIDRIFLISIDKIIEQLNGNIFELDTYLNEFINNTLNLLMFLEYEDCFYGKKFETDETNKISTVGFYVTKDNYLFELLTAKAQKHYVLLLNSESSDSKNIITNMNKLLDNNTSYEVHLTSEENVIFVILSTNLIQEFYLTI